MMNGRPTYPHQAAAAAEERKKHAPILNIVAQMIREANDHFSQRVAKGELIFGRTSVYACPICGKQRLSLFVASDQVVNVAGERRIVCPACASYEARVAAGLQPAERAQHLERLVAAVVERDSRERKVINHQAEYEEFVDELRKEGDKQHG